MKKPNKKPTRKEKETSSPRQDLIKRVMDAKNKLPSSGISPLFFHRFPKYETVKGKSRLNNVLQFRATDEDITEKLEELASVLS